VAGFVLSWAVVAYLVMPTLSKRYVRRHPWLADIPNITHAKTGVPGDPLNVALIGTEEEVVRIMVAAGWDPADPLTFHSSLRIVGATVLRRPYGNAPVSDLFLFGRKQDHAFEQPVGHDPRLRHHVRFWRAEKAAGDGRPVWVGGATFDQRVELSRRTGQVTHRIAADVDAERDKLLADLKETGHLLEEYAVEGFHQVCEGRNGGGDPWHTDGNLSVAVVKPPAPSSPP
jgi:hypothetical protein